MLWDESAVKANIRNREGKRVFYLGKNDTLTPSARDLLSRERIAVLPAEQAKKERWKLLSGGFIEEKPEHMTHLDGDTLVLKTHPRIRFRGMVDALEAELLLCQLHCTCKKELQEILGLARRIIACEVLGDPVGPFTLGGMDESQQRHRSHFPQEYYGIPHFTPSAGDGEEILLLNRCRCVCRQTELAAAAAFTDDNGGCTREDILQALNRMSSMLYLLMIRKAADAGGKS